MKTMSIAEKSINTIRCLSMDAVQQANSGHPGTPMALAPAAYVLWMEHLQFNPQHPEWFNRDRFVLSNGHASMLQYAVLHLTGYNITLDDLKHFRQWGSNTPGHPEYRHTPGIETTTGPLGQGIMTAVGMALAEAHLAGIFNQEEALIHHYTYAFCSDGDIMEGASHEAASVAGHQRLGRLICLYDNNHITIEGNTSLTYSDDVVKRFEAYNWHVQDLGDKGNDLQAISAAFAAAKAVTDKPSLIVLRTHIGYGSPHKQDKPEAHGSPLGEEEIRLTKEFYGWPPDEKFLVPEDVKAHMQTCITRGAAQEATWNTRLKEYSLAYPDLYASLQQYLAQQLPADWDQKVPVYQPVDGPKATREITGAFIGAVADKLPWLVGGSGDLEPSTLTLIKSSPYLQKENYSGRNLAWGIREHVMCAATSGLQLHGGLRAYASTFFIFTDYARPAIRLACIMQLPVIYVMTHDSIGLGEDGTTHQPVEHLASLRAMPHLSLIRPADANETTYAWRAAIQHTGGPTMLVLTRQKLPVIDRSKTAPADNLLKGAYVLSKEQGAAPAVILMATGSEVSLILEAQQQLLQEGIDARVVSMPSWDLFAAQRPEYRESVLPAAVTARVAVEAASPLGWERWTGDRGIMIGMEGFGASAPAKELFKHFGFTVENIVARTKALLSA
ncbi:transketolase [Chitinophaga sp. Mgbs1]|uniref:Transketolase n=1 Tax=Chitinophaga solisilvae TaxID=1233460 RepID=A0A3S1CZZ4_9BACT|nr:transketolase [Chitinophaga solisilvae]